MFLTANIFQEHKRSVNRVAFHGSEHNQLLSASQDGMVMIHVSGRKYSREKGCFFYTELFQETIHCLVRRVVMNYVLNLYHFETFLCTKKKLTNIE